MTSTTTTAPSRGATLPWDSGRDPAVDLVRGLAVVFMVIAHVRVWAPITTTPVKVTIALVNNVASPLFAIVMGISAGIVLTRVDRRVTGGVFVVRNVVRGLALIVIGLLLTQLHTFVAIVLQALGATLIVASPLALLPVPALAATTLVTFVAGPWVNAAARSVLDPGRVHSPALLDQVLQWFVLSTHYRVVSLLPFVLAGVLLARYRLSARAALVSLAVGVVAGVGVLGLRLSGRGVGISEVVSGDLPDSLLDVALAASTLGVVVLFARWRPMQPVVRALAPVRATGAMALTAYVLHVGLIAIIMNRYGWVTPMAHWVVFAGGVLVATVAFCQLWWWLLGKGPIERLMGLVTDPIR